MSRCSHLGHSAAETPRPKAASNALFLDPRYKQIAVGKLVARRKGLELGERQPLMSGAAARMGGGGVRSLAGSAETPRPKAASNALKQARRFKLVVAVK